MRADMATKADIARREGEIADVKSEVRSLRADVPSDLLLLEKRLGDQIATLDRAVMQYHASAIGHGGLHSELEERIIRIEDRLNRFSPEGH